MKVGEGGQSGGLEVFPDSPLNNKMSAYTEPFPMNPASAGLSADEDHGRTSEEEEGVAEQSYDRQIDGRSRAFYVAKELVDSERVHVSAIKHLEEGYNAT
ncbi:hypothetical protein INR49_012621 [Caranx melampygus]|nr:hypothetical protein INR49_012621 [Caranx melampygus]